MMDKSALNILVLDDDAFILKVVERMLTGLGYEKISCFDNGIDALAAYDARNDIADVILLDVNMPVMDGIEVVRSLADRKYSGSLILISGEDDRMLESISRLARAHHFTVLGAIHKPPLKGQLSALLDSWQPARDESRPKLVKSYTAQRLQEAIVNGELVNYYQPKVAVVSGKLVGVETLVRWQHPVDGMVFPDSFIPVAEQNGLIGELTRVVLKQALMQLKIWQQAGIFLRVAINVSMDDITHLEFADIVHAETLAAGVSPESVVLEVTESRLMQELTTSLDVLTRLSLKRFGLSIDDFGTGHSSLAQLRDLPFDELKIDQSFTRNAWQNAKLSAIFEGSMHLANQLKMEVVAEGVEEINDWNFLRSTGCQTAQGYFIARPMPASQLPVWMEDWKQRRANGVLG